MSVPWLLPYAPTHQIRTSSTSDRTSSSLTRAPPLLHIGALGGYSTCQYSSPSTPLLRGRWNTSQTPPQILRCIPVPSTDTNHIPTKVISGTLSNTTAVACCRETSPSRCRLLPPSEEFRPEIISNPLSDFRPRDISPSRKTFLRPRVSPLRGYSSDSISTLTPLSPLSPDSPTFPCHLHSNTAEPATTFSSSNSGLRKSQSALIMPSLLTFFRSESMTPISGGVIQGGHIPRENSSRSLTDASCPSPMMRKCHTMIALSGAQGSSPTVTRLTKEKKRLTLMRRITSSKSTGFTSNKSSCTSLPGTHQPLPSMPRSPSASCALQKYRRTSGSSNMWPHFEHPDETVDIPSLISGECIDEDRLSGGTVSRCSRCASAGSLYSNLRHSAVINDGVFCKLCLTEISVRETYQLQQCHCRFCTYCMRMYTTLKIREGEPYIDCPDSNCDCSGELTLDEVESLVGKELLGLHLKFRSDREVDLDPMKTWCPRPGCNTVVSLSLSKLDGLPQCSCCPTCDTCFCAACSYTWHPGKPCHKAPGPLDISLNDKIKRCPRCKVPIERDAGCAQMQCKKCKHVFCWYCLASLEDDFLLRHYDKGPCKNKLGHSRASVLLHRAQVVVIFAGFGLLLVIASPILLFVGPCLLCRSCRACTRSESDDESSSSI